MSKLDLMEEFQQEVWQYYDQHGRHDLPWRLPELKTEEAGSTTTSSFDPYKVMVSEIMLQQTQVNRVIPKYLAFIEQFPTAQDLANAPLSEVLITWQGLGYNRRAKFLWQAAQIVANEYNGVFPQDQKELTKLPGVGVNTAGAIMAYAHNAPVVFLETNIRTVYIHHFFNDQTDVRDKDIAELVKQTLPNQDETQTDKGQDTGTGEIRQWYWALMDYGTHIKQAHGNKSRASKAYAKQSPFQGSKRQVRGAVIRYLSQKSGTLQEIAEAESDTRLPEIIKELLKEDMVREDQGYYRLA